MSKRIPVLIYENRDTTRQGHEAALFKILSCKVVPVISLLLNTEDKITFNSFFFFFRFLVNLFLTHTLKNEWPKLLFISLFLVLQGIMLAGHCRLVVFCIKHHQIQCSKHLLLAIPDELYRTVEVKVGTF